MHHPALLDWICVQDNWKKKIKGCLINKNLGTTGMSISNLSIVEFECHLIREHKAGIAAEVIFKNANLIM